jgi:ATP-binding cassette, subfamily B, bacterial CvaB/MchF/RaxB
MNEPRRSRLRITPIFQGSYAECGLVCVAMILQYFGNRADLAELRTRWNAGLRGLSVRQIIDILDSYHVAARPLRVELSDLAQLNTPSILHWNFDHFVILECADSRFIYIVDPAIGRRRLTLQAASKHFTGIALEMQDIGSFHASRAPDRPTSFRDLLPSRGVLARSVIPVLILTLGVNGLALLLPFFLKLSFETIVPRHDLSKLTAALTAFLAVVVLHYVIQILRGTGLCHFRRTLSSHVSTKIFDSVVWSKMSFFEVRNPSTIVNQYGSVNNITAVISEQFVSKSVDILAVLIGTMLIALFSPLLALILIASVGGYFLIHRLMSGELRSRMTEMIQSESNEHAYFVETVNCMTAIRLASKESSRGVAWRNIREEVEGDYSSYGRYRNYLSSTQEMIMNMTWLTVVYLSVRQHLAGVLTLGVVTAIVSWVNFVISRSRDIAQSMLEFELLQTHVARLDDIVRSPKLAERSPVLCVKSHLGTIGMNNVWFRYSEGGPWILKCCSFHLQRSGFTGVIGPSGSGKTTFLKLFVGLLEPTQGKIIAGDSLEGTEATDAICRHSAVVMQNDSLLMGSIGENISFFDVEPDLDLVRNCASISCIHEFIDSLPMKYDSIVGRCGQGFSAGQIQRLLLARALYRQPSILFLDEFSSNMDEDLERTLLTNLKRLDITILSIAHRRQVIEFCTNLYRCSAGQLVPVERGQSQAWQDTLGMNDASVVVPTNGRSDVARL